MKIGERGKRGKEMTVLFRRERRGKGGRMK